MSTFLIVQLILFFCLFGNISSNSKYEDSSVDKKVNGISAALKSNQNSYYEDDNEPLENQEFEDLKRSKRDDLDLNEETDYIYEDEDEEENSEEKEAENDPVPFNSEKVSQSNAGNDQSPKSQLNLNSKMNSKTSLNKKADDSYMAEKSLEKKATASVKSSLNNDILYKKLETFRKELKDSMEKKLSQLRDEMKNEIELRHKSDEFLKLNARDLSNLRGKGAKDNFRENENEETKVAKVGKTNQNINLRKSDAESSVKRRSSSVNRPIVRVHKRAMSSNYDAKSRKRRS